MKTRRNVSPLLACLSLRKLNALAAPALAAPNRFTHIHGHTQHGAHAYGIMDFMSVTDPDCGPCDTVKLPRGKTFKIIHEFPKALEHHYPLPALDATSVPVYRGSFDLNGARYQGTITLKLEPSPKIVARGVLKFTGPAEMLDFINPRTSARWLNKEELSIPARKLPAPAKTARPPKLLKPTNAVNTSATYLDGIDVGDPDGLEHLTFYVFNAWFSKDGLNTCYNGNARHGRVETILGEWQLRIEPRGDVSPDELRKHQHETEKSTITHIGRIRRDDGQTFSANDAMEVLGIVETLMSFALGRVTAIVLPVGYRAGDAVWSRWECNKAVDRPTGITPFLDRDHAAEQMSELFRAGYVTSKDRARWQVFENALGYHYAVEYEATVNMKVLHPVSALQLISYAYLVEELPSSDPNHLTDREWKDSNLRTVGQLRNLLDAAGIDTSVPKHLARLVDVQSAITGNHLTAPDALDCVVRLRNMVAHPKQKDVKKWSTEEWAETGFAATTLFNVAMLWWLKYDSLYLGKTTEFWGPGGSTFVPWHKS